MGYYALFMGLQYRNDQEMNQKIDADNFNKSESMTIKIPITVPYATDSRDFERVNGKFEYNGEFYRLVKQKLSQDTLIIVCVKDHEHKRIHRAFVSYVETFSNTPVDTQSTTENIVINFSKDYISNTLTLRNLAQGWESNLLQLSSCETLAPAFYSLIIHPPEHLE
jgi:hypothetical protein